jgi:hypothetical protein
MGGIGRVGEGIIADLAARLPRQRKTRRAKLGPAAALPRPAERQGMRYQWLERLLANPRLEIDAVMAPHARELLGRAAASGRRLVLILDRTQATARHQVLMLDPFSRGAPQKALERTRARGVACLPA